MDLNISEKWLKDDDLELYVKFKTWYLDQDLKYFTFDGSNYINLENVSKIIWEKSSQDFESTADVEEDNYVDCFGVNISKGLVRESKLTENQFVDYLEDDYLPDHPLEEGRYIFKGTCYFDWDDLEVKFEITDVEEE